MPTLGYLGACAEKLLLPSHIGKTDHDRADSGYENSFQTSLKQTLLNNYLTDQQQVR